MSILFEAWRRAHGGDSRLAETLGAPAAPRGRRPPALLWLLCLLLAAIVGGLAVLIWLDQSRAPRTVARAMPAALPVAKNLTEKHPTAKKMAPAAQPKPRAPAPSAAKPAKPGAGEAPSQPARLHPATPAVSAPHASAAVKTPDAPDNNPTQARGGGKTQSGAPPEPVPFASAPDAIRARFPALGIVAHVWNPEADKRFVVIGGRQYRAGDEIATGVRLEKITRQGEVVAFRGYRLILK